MSDKKENVVYLDDLIKALSDGLGKELMISEDETKLIDSDGIAYATLGYADSEDDSDE